MTTEAKEQEALFQIASYHPIAKDYLWANCNDGKRSPMEGSRFKRRGLKPGVPDVSLPYPASGFHGLFIELKRRDKKNKPTADQLIWIHKLRKAGNYANVAYGWEDAWNQIKAYLENKLTSENKFDLTIKE
jgi:hypothetical protein